MCELLVTFLSKIAVVPKLLAEVFSPFFKVVAARGNIFVVNFLAVLVRFAKHLREKARSSLLFQFVVNDASNDELCHYARPGMAVVKRKPRDYETGGDHPEVKSDLKLSASVLLVALVDACAHRRCSRFGASPLVERPWCCRQCRVRGCRGFVLRRDRPTGTS